MLVTPSVSDLTHADIFTALFRDSLAFVPAWGWMWFNGKYWEGGEHKTLEMAGEVIKMRIAALNPEKEPRMLRMLENFSNRSRLQGMIDLAKSKLRIPADMFDADPYRLNAGNGVIDLRTGELAPHAPEQHNTKWSPVTYDPDAASTKWHDAVMGIACNDERLYLFLQHLAGYAASGDVSAQRLYYFYGAGANGKSMFTDLIAEVLGGFSDTGYAVRLGNETILGRAERPAGAPSPDLLSLKGKRLALFSEQSGTRFMNTERIKDLSGGDAISARAPHCASVTFHPTHTLVCCGNHVPYVNASDHGFWRRLLVVPFRAQFKPSRLGEELHSPENLTAILAWTVKGAMSLFKDDWSIPACIEEASASCRDESNLLTQWLGECCERVNVETWSTTLYDSYNKWCIRRNECRMSQSLFTRQMEQLGFAKRKSNGKPNLQGVRLRAGQIAEVAAQPVGTA